MLHRNRWTLALVAVLCILLLAGLAGCSKESKKESHFKKGEAYLTEGKFREASIEFKNVLQIDPNDSKAYFKLGMASLGAGDPREAYAAFNKAIELDPNSVEARVHLGRLFLMAREPEKAREQARIVLEKDPNNAMGHQLMSMVYLSDRKLPEAIANGWPLLRGREAWVVEYGEQNEAWPEWLAVRTKSAKGVKRWIFHFYIQDGHWVIRDWIPVVDRGGPGVATRARGELCPHDCR